MTLGWQDLVALALVAVAFLVFLRSACFPKESTGGCGGCQVHQLRKQRMNRTTNPPIDV